VSRDGVLFLRPQRQQPGEQLVGAVRRKALLDLLRERQKRRVA
jgi:hypothetical protein